MKTGPCGSTDTVHTQIPPESILIAITVNELQVSEPVGHQYLMTLFFLRLQFVAVHLYQDFKLDFMMKGNLRAMVCSLDSYQNN